MKPLIIFHLTFWPSLLGLASPVVNDEFGDLRDATYHRRVPDRSNIVNDVAPLGVAVVVSHREFVLGCHSWDRFLDPRWETYYVFGHEFIRQWDLKSLVARQTAATTRGVHVVALGQGHTGGAQVSRLAMSLDLQRRHVPQPEFTMACNCDIHPLPSWHDWHKPFNEQVAMMVRDFRAEKKARASASGTMAETFGVESYFEWKHVTGHDDELYTRIQRQAPRAKVVAMTTVMMETVPSKHDLTDAVLHGIDFGHWQKRGGSSGWRPEKFSHRPWLSDTSLWPEDHLVLYDTDTLLRIIQKMRRAGSSIVEMDRLLPQVLANRNWSAVRHNDVLQFYDLGAKPLFGKDRDGHLYHIFDPYVFRGIDYRGWLIPLNLDLFANRSSPLACFQEVAMIKIVWGMHVASWCGFPAAHLEREHLGLENNGKGLTVAQLQDRIDPIMRLVGYTRIEQDDKALVYVQLPLFHSRRQVACEREPCVIWKSRTKKIEHRDGFTTWMVLNTPKQGMPPQHTVITSSPLTQESFEMALERATPNVVTLPKNAVIDQLVLPFPHNWLGHLIGANMSWRHASLACYADNFLRGSNPSQETREQVIVRQAMTPLADVCLTRLNADVLLQSVRDKPRRFLRHSGQISITK